MFKGGLSIRRPGAPHHHILSTLLSQGISHRTGGRVPREAPFQPTRLPVSGTLLGIAKCQPLYLEKYARQDLNL